MLSVKLSGQQGMAMVFALIVMLILAMLGGNSLRNSTLETRMASNVQDRSRAFQAAQYAIRQAEEHIRTLVDAGQYTSVFGSETGLYRSLAADGSDCTSTSMWAEGTASWDADDSIVVDITNVSLLGDFTAAANPRYMIGLDTETDPDSACYSATSADGYSDSVGSTNNSVQTIRFTITAIGYGSQPNTRVRLQETWTILN